MLVALGIGLATVQWAYFFAIHRLDIGIALLIQFVAPILVALWARFVFHEPVRRRIWAALALSLAGLTLIVEIWHGGRLSGPGVAACGLAAISLAAYFLVAEHGVRGRDPISLSAWGFLFATIFWSLLAPWWSFPGPACRRPRLAAREPGVDTSAALAADAVDGRPGRDRAFALIVSALRHISATRAGITAMLEPVVAIIVAWAWLGESLQPVQLSGAALTLLGIGLAQTAR